MSDLTNDLEGSAQLRIDDLEPQVVELSDEEIRAVTVAGGGASWTSGSVHRTDEWTLP